MFKSLDLTGLFILVFCLFLGIGLIIDRDLTAQSLGIGLTAASASTLVVAATRQY